MPITHLTFPCFTNLPSGRNSILIAAAALLSLSLHMTAAGAPPPVAEAAWRETDSRLNAVFRQVLRHATEPRLKEDLQKAQRAWVAYRELEAAARAGVSSQGGSAYSSDQLKELQGLTEERLEKMRELLRVIRGEPRKPEKGR